MLSNNESGNDQWNNISDGSFEELPVGYFIEVPDKVNENLERKKSENSHGNIFARYNQNYSFDDIFYGNLRPKDFEILTNMIWVINFTESNNPPDHFNMFADIYLNYADKIKYNQNIYDLNHIERGLNDMASSYFQKGDSHILTTDLTVIDYIREISKYDLSRSNDFYKLTYDNYGDLTSCFMASIMKSENYNQKGDYSSMLYPQKFNGAEEIEEEYEFTPDLDKIEKTGDNEVTVYITSEKHISKGYFRSLIALNEFWSMSADDINNDRIIYLKISEKDMPDGNLATLRLGGYPTNQFTYSDNQYHWHPNQEAKKILNTYFKIMNDSLDSNNIFSPKEAIQEVSELMNYPYDEVQSLVLTYVFSIIGF